MRGLTPAQRQEREEQRVIKEQRLRKFLRKILLRRVNNDVFLGGQILPLPFHQCNKQYIDLNSFEFNVYRIVEIRMQQIIKRMIDDDELRRSYSHVFKLLLILRQLTSHTLMIERALRECLTRGDIEQLARLADAEIDDTKDDERKDDMINLRNLLNEEQTRRLQTSTGGRASLMPNAISQDQLQELGEDYGRTFDFRPYLKDLIIGPNNSFKQIWEGTKCAYCDQKPFAPRITDCYHIYCTGCLHDMQIGAALDDKDRASCIECGVAFKETRSVEKDLYGDEVHDVPEAFFEEDEYEEEGQRAESSARRKQRALEGSWIGRDQGNIVPSAKTVAVKNQVQNWLAEDKGCKIIIYCQFLGVIKLLSRMCQIEGWSYVTYHGSMSHEVRAHALDQFRNNKEQPINILIGTLKTGGYGLNLMFASRVILVEL